MTGPRDNGTKAEFDEYRARAKKRRRARRKAKTRRQRAGAVALSRGWS